MKVEIAEALRDRVSRDLTFMATAHPRSLAAEIRSDHFGAVVDFVAERIDLEINDPEAATLIALADAKRAMPAAFIHRKTRAAFYNDWKK